MSTAVDQPNKFKSRHAIEETRTLNDDTSTNHKSLQYNLTKYIIREHQKPRVIVLSGPSNTAKHSLAIKLQNEFPDLVRRVVPHTTRPPKPLETEGIDYQFIHEKEMKSMIENGLLLEHVYIDDTQCILKPSLDELATLTDSAGGLYGTAAHAYFSCMASNCPVIILTLNYEGALYLKGIGFRAEFIILAPYQEETIIQRFDSSTHFISSANSTSAYSELKSLLVSAEISTSLIDKESSKFNSTNSPSQSFIRAEAEWEMVQTIQAEMNDNPLNGRISAKNRKIPHLNSTQALDFFRSQPSQEYISKIRLPPYPNAIIRLYRYFIGPPALLRELIEERNLILVMAACQFDNCSTFHSSVLETIYSGLTGSKMGCNRYGPHWEDIGFQGNDPATDLRGVGFLGLVNLLDILTCNIASQLALDIYKLSRDSVQEFPFCALSMNLTAISLSALRDNRLSKECNRRRMVFTVFNDFYKSLFYRFFIIYGGQHKTLENIGFILNELEYFARRNVSQVLSNYNEYLELRQKQSMNSFSQVTNNTSHEVSFTGIAEIQDESHAMSIE